MEYYQGLSDSEVALRLKRDGFNEIPSQKPKNVFSMLYAILREPMIFLLVAAGLIYLLLGEPKDAFVLLVSIFVVIAVTFYQERKTENTLRALKDLSSPRALVVRNGQQIRVVGREVVVDDTIIVREGDRVPADAKVISSQNLQVDESLLTGESLSVVKHPDSEDTSGYVFSGTLVTQGSGVALVKRIGIETEMGKIGKTLGAIADEDSLLKKEIGRIVKVFAILGIVSCTALIIIRISIDGNLLNAFLSGLTLSMSMLPEEFPVVMLIFLTLGAWRISKKQVLTRNNQAIETLGATTVLCVDKTGTLTMNKMELSTIITTEEITDFTSVEGELNPKTREVLEYAKLASKRGAFDPLEKEINSKFEKYISKGEAPLKDWHLIKVYELTKELFALTRVWKSPDRSEYIVGSKGAPEAIMEQCRLGEEEKKVIMKTVSEMSKKGERVLGVAKSEFAQESLPGNQRDFNFKFLGLLGFVDPLRSEVKNSVEECYSAGMRVIMITGDYPGTAQYIAEQAGIKNPHNFMTGKDLVNISKEDLREKIKEVNIFARIVPEQKLIIVEALKDDGEIVAMTGDGVNDGPALKSAHIGIAMGERGTDVARESADLVLINDDFTSIVSAVKVGRLIYDNLQKAISYIFSIHIPIAGVALLPTLFNFPIVLFPVHIAFLELIIDPACSTVYESSPPEEGIMKRAPRKVDQPLFAKNNIAISLFQGITILAFVMAVFILAISIGREEAVSRTMAFLTIVLCNLVLIFSNLSRESLLLKFRFHKNKVFYLISVLAIGFMVLVLNVPFLRELFHFSNISFMDFFIIVSMSLLCYVWLEFIKVFRSGKTVVLK